MTIKKLIPILTLITTGLLSVAPEAEALRLISRNDEYETVDFSSAIDTNYQNLGGNIGTEMFTSESVDFNNPINNIQLNTALQITNSSDDFNAVGNLVTMYGQVYPTVEFNTSMELGEFQNEGAHEVPEPSTIFALATILSCMGISGVAKKKK